MKNMTTAIKDNYVADAHATIVRAKIVNRSLWPEGRIRLLDTQVWGDSGTSIYHEILDCLADTKRYM